MFQSVGEVEPRRMRWIKHQLSDVHVLSAINIEVEQATGVASVVWAERTPGDVTKIAVVGFLIETCRLDIGKRVVLAALPPRGSPGDDMPRCA